MVLDVPQNADIAYDFIYSGPDVKKTSEIYSPPKRVLNGKYAVQRKLELDDVPFGTPFSKMVCLTSFFIVLLVVILIIFNAGMVQVQGNIAPSSRYQQHYQVPPFLELKSLYKLLNDGNKNFLVKSIFEIVRVREKIFQTLLK